MQTDIGSQVKLPTGMTEAEMQKVFDARWWSEVNDPQSGYAHLRTNTTRVVRREADGVGSEQWRERWGGQEEDGVRYIEDDEEGDASVPSSSSDVSSSSGPETGLDNDADEGETVEIISHNKPPTLKFGKLSADVLSYRELARKGKEREDALRKRLRGTEVEHWRQGEMDFGEEEVEERK